MPPPYKEGDDVRQIAESLDNKTKKQVYGKAYSRAIVVVLQAPVPPPCHGSDTRPACGRYGSHICPGRRHAPKLLSER